MSATSAAAPSSTPAPSPSPTAPFPPTAAGATAPWGGGGGGIASYSGTLTVTNSTSSGNSGGHGGGILHEEGTLTVTNSTFDGNSAEVSGGLGGGIYSGGNLPASNSIFLTVTNSTFSGNSAGNSGGAIFTLGQATLSNSTISGNGGYGIGIGICSSPPYVFCTDSRLTVTNSIVADSTDRGDCRIYSGTVTDGGHNLIGNPATACGLTNGVNGNIVGVNALLDFAGLKDNGGPTQSIALQADSPAINAGDETICAAAPVNNRDQRGYVRPGTGATRCSIGAYEFDSPGPPACDVGDCNHSDAVTIDEIITLVNIALGTAQSSECPNGIPSSADVNVALIIQAVNHALNGCSG